MSDRLITNDAKAGWRQAAFAPNASRAGFAAYAAYAGYAMYAGYKDFPRPDQF